MIVIFSAIRWLRRRLLPPDFPGRRFLRSAYVGLVRRTAWMQGGHGVPVSIGGCGTFELDPLIASGRYEEWGSGHNSGLARWVVACTGKRTVLDVGAHIGLYTLPASRVIAPDGLIYAFEPAARNVEVLERHLRFNRVTNVRVVPCLVGQLDTGAAAFFERADQVDGMNAVAVHKQRHLYVETSRPQVTLDRFCADEGIRPDVVKIDVEGAEMNLIRGATRVLREDRPTLFLSVHPGRLEALDASPDAVATLLTQLGYRAYRHDGATATRLEFDEYVIVPAERAGATLEESWLSAH